MDIKQYIKDRKVIIDSIPELDAYKAQSSKLVDQLEGSKLGTSLLGLSMRELLVSRRYYYWSWVRYKDPETKIPCLRVGKNIGYFEFIDSVINFEKLIQYMFLDKVFTAYGSVENIPNDLNSREILDKIEEDLVGTVFWHISGFSPYNLCERSLKVLHHQVKITSASIDVVLNLGSYRPIDFSCTKIIGLDLTNGKTYNYFENYGKEVFPSEEDLITYLSASRDRAIEKTEAEIARAEEDLQRVLETRRTLYRRREGMEERINKLLSI